MCAKQVYNMFNWFIQDMLYSGSISEAIKALLGKSYIIVDNINESSLEGTLALCIMERDKAEQIVNTLYNIMF